MTQPSLTIRERRLSRGWTQEDLARRCTEAGAEVTHTTLSKIERGTQVPRPKLRSVLANLLELDVTDFDREAS